MLWYTTLETSFSFFLATGLWLNEMSSAFFVSTCFTKVRICSLHITNHFCSHILYPTRILLAYHQGVIVVQMQPQSRSSTGKECCVLYRTVADMKPYTILICMGLRVPE